MGGTYELNVRSKLLFCTPHSGAETAGKISKHLNDSLIENTWLSIIDFEKSFKFVTDWAATMPKVFGSSLSPARVPFSHRLVDCVPYHLNTCMKNTLQFIFKILTTVKSIIATVKHAAPND